MIALPEATLFRTGPYRLVRKALLHEYRIDGIIALPEGAFAPCTSIPSSLILFRREEPRSEVRFITVPAKPWFESAEIGPAPADSKGSERQNGSGLGEDTNFESAAEHPRQARPSLIRDLASMIRQERPVSSDVPTGVDSWDVAITALAARDYELVAKRTGADELEDILHRVVTADTTIKLVPLKQVAEIALGISYDKTVTSTNPNAVGLFRTSAGWRLL